jgi:single stranded DNA-binding protein
MSAKVHLVGRVFTPIERKAVAAGKSFGSFRMSTSYKIKEEWQSNWFTIKLFDESLVSMTLNKGDRVELSGSLQIRPYKDKNGVDKQSVEVLANTLTLVQKDNYPSFNQNQTQYVQPTAVPYSGITEEDVPF